MATEIEHKYLINLERWKNIVPHESVEIQQVYLQTDPEKTIRVRNKGGVGYITVKGKKIEASRPEFEIEIPVADADELIQMFYASLVVKIRHHVIYDNKLWEVDEFKGLNQGLWVAEIELKKEDEPYSIPDWAIENVTDDFRYSNSSLSIRPFSEW